LTEASSIARAALAVLTTADARAKAAASRVQAAAWRAGELTHEFDIDMPDAPARPDRPELLPPGRMPKRGRAGSARSRFALLHALAHIELNAIDLAWDLIGRFGAGAPRAFVDDWVAVADDEARHFVMLDERLRELGGGYGDLPAHDGLWQAAAATAHDLPARLAVVPQVLEARGLDVTPTTVVRLRAVGDDASADILESIYRDEIAHVRAGNSWFRWTCDANGSSPEISFRSLVSTYFKGELKPPFNDLARADAGLSPDFYLPLAMPDQGCLETDTDRKG
jgi:uncharacterized ferritin-like protein (DUF455 family)